MRALFHDKLTLLITTKSVDVEASELKRLMRQGMKITNLMNAKKIMLAKLARSVNVRKTALLRLKRLIINQHLNKSHQCLHRHL